MKAASFAEAVELALADADATARRRRKLKPFYTRADRISHATGWMPWWDRPQECAAGHVDPDWYVGLDNRGWRVRRCAECERARGRLTTLGEGE